MYASIQIEKTVADWMARRDRHDWSEADQVELTAWLSASTAHHLAYIRLQVAWQRVLRLKAVAAGAELAQMRSRALRVDVCAIEEVGSMQS